MCVCVCVRGSPEREKAMLSRVMYLMIMEAYAVCALIKLFGILMVFKLVGHVLVIIAVLLYLLNECLVVS